MITGNLRFLNIMFLVLYWMDLCVRYLSLPKPRLSYYFGRWNRISDFTAVLLATIVQATIILREFVIFGFSQDVDNNDNSIMQQQQQQQQHRFWSNVEAMAQTILLARILTARPLREKYERIGSLSKLLTTTFWPMMTYFTVMLLLSIYFFASLGFLLFKPPEHLLDFVNNDSMNSDPYATFETPSKAYMLVFQVFSGSSWHYPMIVVMKTHGTLPAAVFFASFYLLANTILVVMVLLMLVFGSNNIYIQINNYTVLM
mmetsp:Transcript_17366/g.28762  ORF Transcript_17366/g.28762 Transcript_17366/m.28762 type:complete len:258 (+) Transcript_17366:860-1633(+)